MTDTQALELINKFLSGTASPEEKLLLERWYEEFDASALEFEATSQGQADSMRRSLAAVREKIAREGAPGEPHPLAKRRHRSLYRWAAAAAVLLLVGVAGYFLSGPRQITSLPGIAFGHQDIRPGTRKAVLSLGNGSTVALDSLRQGVLSRQGNTSVIKVKNGLLTYASRREAAGHAKDIPYNTVTTPRGGQYQIVLSDGSRVWLNSASSIRFPTRFTNTGRDVSVTGEVYFEIAPQDGAPFIVTAGKVSVQVLGTHFNVMAYPDEPTVKTTLLEGSVKVARDGKTLVLKPGQQAEVNGEGTMKLVTGVNTDEIVAWKNNLFWFDGNDIREVMNALARWYDVDIDITGDIPDRFTGSIPMDLPFSKVFGMLQQTGRINYRIVGDKKIIVSP